LLGLSRRLVMPFSHKIKLKTTSNDGETPPNPTEVKADKFCKGRSKIFGPPPTLPRFMAWSAGLVTPEISYANTTSSSRYVSTRNFVGRVSLCRRQEGDSGVCGNTDHDLNIMLLSPVSYLILLQLRLGNA
jgi:hypothetical protein